LQAVRANFAINDNTLLLLQFQAKETVQICPAPCYGRAPHVAAAAMLTELGSLVVSGI
jgi:hypothetical protein